MGIAFSPALDEPGAGLVDPDALAATARTARRSGAAASSNSSPTATGDRLRATSRPRLQVHGSDRRRRQPVPTPLPRSCVCAPGAIRLRRRRGLRASPDVALTYHRRPASDRRPATYGMIAGRDLCSSPRRSRARSSTITFTYAIPTGLRPEPDAGLQPDRPRFRRREGQQRPGPGQRVDPFSLPTIQRIECLLARQPICRDAGRGARPIADRTLTARASARPSRRTRFATSSSSGRSSRRRSCSASSTSARNSPSS